MQPKLNSIRAELLSASNRVRENLALLVRNYHIDESDDSKSYVHGVDFFDQDKSYFVKLSPNTKSNVTLKGFLAPQSPSDSDKNYNVPINGVIMFDDVKKVPPFSKVSSDLSAPTFLTAEWARSAVRVKTQGITLNYTTVNIAAGTNGRDDTVFFNTYNPRISQVIDLQASNNPMVELENAIIRCLSNSTKNTTLSLMRIYSDDINEKPLCSQINSFRIRDTNALSTPQETLNRFKNSEEGKILFSIIEAQLIGKPFKIEVTPGMRYFLSPKGRESCLIESDIPNRGRIINPNSFIGTLAKQCSYTVKEQNNAGDWVNVSRPRAIEMFLLTTVLEDGGKIVTSINSKSSKISSVDYADIPSSAKAQSPVLNNTATQTAQHQDDKEVFEDPHNNINEDDFDVELSDEDIAALSEITAITRTM